MKRAFSFTLATALLATLAVTSATRLSHAQGQRPVEAGGGAPDIIKHRPNDNDAGTGFAPTAGGTAALSAISYHGGPLIGTPTAYLIWYGSWNRGNGTDTPEGQQIVRDFLNNLGGSPYFQINTTYSAGGTTINGAVGGVGGEVSPGYSHGTRLRDATIQTIVNEALNAGLPRDANGVYFVLTSSDVNEQSGFCTQYCGWHTSASSTIISNGRVRYSFVGNAARCLNACAAQTASPNGNAGVDAMLSVVAHELEEATTDPDPRSGWADSGGSENADKCAWTFSSHQYQTANGSWANMHLGTRDFLIQRNLAATDNKCYIDWVNKYQ
jgi:hypothetical protein